jgi:PleD family two-component response regulator
MSLDLLRYHPQPRVLLASKEAWQTRELKDALESAGLRVTIAHDERETLDLAHSLRPHGILLDAGVAPPGYGLCRTIRTIVFASPIVLLRPGQPSRDEQLDALRAGAWELRGAPLDTEDLILHLASYLEPKLELDRASEECLVDRVSGLYNHLGLAKRADELAALVTRHGLALACVVFRPAAKLPSRAASDRLALTFKSVGRTSDAVGRTGPAEFAVFAPATNAWAAGRLVRRLTDSAEREFGYIPERGGRVGVRTGYSAMLAAHKISPHTLLARARSALEAS